MKSLRGVILIGCLMFLVSCSSSAGGGKWVKPGSGEAEFDEDYYRCKRYANNECDLTEWPGYLVQKNCIDKLMKDCLNSSGWEYQKPK